MEETKYTDFLLDDTVYETMLPAKFSKRKPYQKTDPRKIIAFIPGLIEKVYVRKGTVVKVGDKLLVLEAMKMKNDVNSPVNGIVKEISVKEGIKVAKGEFLLELE
jgi:biotin carboxyl carrier protein